MQGEDAMSGKVILVTGAASDIGAATARTAVRRGHRVALADINLPGAAELSAKLAVTRCLDVGEVCDRDCPAGGRARRHWLVPL